MSSYAMPCRFARVELTGVQTVIVKIYFELNDPT